MPPSCSWQVVGVGTLNHLLAQTFDHNVQPSAQQTKSRSVTQAKAALKGSQAEVTPPPPVPAPGIGGRSHLLLGLWASVCRSLSWLYVASSDTS